jgi:hypothetical protein
MPDVVKHALCCRCCQVIAKEAGMPQAELQARVQALLNVLPDMDTKLQAMRPADVVRLMGLACNACAACGRYLCLLAPLHWLAS